MSAHYRPVRTSARWCGIRHRARAARVVGPATGFLLSSRAPGATGPDRWIALVYVGALAVASSVLAIGIALLAS